MQPTNPTGAVLDPTRFTKRRCKTPVPEEVDVAIIGAGLGGLTAGAYLARHGLSVAIFDSHYVAGGCTTMFQRRGKEGVYNFDVGLHYVGDCVGDAMIPRTLAGAGVELDWLPMDQDGFDVLVFPDFTFRIPSDRDLYRQRLLDLFPEERRGIDRYLRMVREVDSLQHTMEGPERFMNLKLGWTALTRGRLAARHRDGALGPFLDTCTHNPHLRAVLCGQHGDYGIPPSNVSCMLHAGLANHYLKGAYYPRGGGQVISDRLSEEFEAAGGSIVLRCGIERILVENGTAVGVRTEAGKSESRDVRAKAVISNADIIKTFSRLLPAEHQPAAWRKRVSSFEMAGAIFMTFLGVKGDMRERGMAACNYWVVDGYELDQAYDEQDVSSFEVKGCYITSGSVKDPDSTGHAPSGVTGVEVMTMMPGDPAKWGIDPVEAEGNAYRAEGNYKAMKHRIEDQLIDRLEQQFPGSKDSVVFRESASPVTQVRYTRATGGTGYGLAATPAQFMDRRPDFRGPIPGLYLCGASTQAGHGILGAVTSGRKAAGRVATDLGRALDR